MSDFSFTQRSLCLRVQATTCFDAEANNMDFFRHRTQYHSS